MIKLFIYVKFLNMFYIVNDRKKPGQELSYTISSKLLKCYHLFQFSIVKFSTNHTSNLHNISLQSLRHQSANLRNSIYFLKKKFRAFWTYVYLFWYLNGYIITKICEFAELQVTWISHASLTSLRDIHTGKVLLL